MIKPMQLAGYSETLYALRHRATRRFMPELKGGYSYWEPAEGEVDAPVRLFPATLNACRARDAWARGHHYMVTNEHWESGEIDAHLDIEPVPGRNRDDLEIVEMTLKEKRILWPWPKK